MATADELLDALMHDCKKPGDLIGENGLLNQLLKKSIEQTSQAEKTEHMHFPPHAKGDSDV